jgi:hypothetical protein
LFRSTPRLERQTDSLTSFSFAEALHHDGHVGVGVGLGISARPRSEQDERTQSFAESLLEQAPIFDEGAFELDGARLG